MRTALLAFTLLAGTVAGAPSHATPSAQGAVPAPEAAGVQPAYCYYYRTYQPCYRIYRPYVVPRFYYYRPRYYRRNYAVPY